MSAKVLGFTELQLKKVAYALLVVLFILSIVLSGFYVYKTHTSKGIGEQVASSDMHESSPVDKIVVDISGSILSPGAYIVPSSSRLKDVLALAGGLSDTADIYWVHKNINLSLKLHDEQKIYFPFVWDTLGTPDDMCGIKIDDPSSLATPQEVSQSSSSERSVGSVNDKNINTMTLEELDALKGIGIAYANRIIANRPYKDFSDLVNKSKVPQSILDSLSKLISY